MCETNADSLTLEQICKDLKVSEKGAGPLYASKSGPVFNGRPANAGVATNQSTRLPKDTRIKFKKTTVKQIRGRINAPRLQNGRYQKLLQPALLTRNSSACLSPTTCSTAVAATGTSAPDATSTSPMMSSSTTPSVSNLATLIYSSYILIN